MTHYERPSLDAAIQPLQAGLVVYAFVNKSDANIGACRDLPLKCIAACTKSTGICEVRRSVHLSRW